MAGSGSGDLTRSTVEASTGSIALEQVDGAAVLRVTGSLDLVLAPKVRQMVDRALRSRPDLVVIDLGGVDFLASAGLAALVTAHRRCVPEPGLRVVTADRVTLRPLEITRLTDLLAVFPSLTAALAPR